MLNAEQHLDLVMLLGKALRPDALVWMVESVMGRDAVAGFRDNINNRAALAERAVQLLEEAGKTQEAVQQLLAEGTPNTHLVFGLRTIMSNERLNEETLQSFTNDFEPFMSAAGVGDLMIRLRHVVCAIGNAKEGKLKGTGFLIGKDLVLTNYHVIKEFTRKVDGKVVEDGDGTDICCYFDYLWQPAPPVPPPNGARLNVVTVRAVKQQWLIHGRPFLDNDGMDDCAEPKNNELDYAVIKLADEVGTRPVRKSGGSLRGWIPLETAIDVLDTGARLIVFQHPAGVPQQFDVGEYKRLAVKNTRVWYSVSAAKGSSGGATVRIDGKLFALHNAEVRSPPAGPNERLNQGIRIDYIAKDLSDSVPGWVAPGAANGQSLGYWSLNDDATNPQPVIGRLRVRDAIARMRVPGGRRAIVVRGPAGSGVRFSSKLLRRVLGVRAPIVEFSPKDLASLEPRAFLRVLADQLSLSGLADNPIPEPKGTENTSRWLRNDLPEWLFARLSEDAARRPAEYPAWIVIDAMTPGERLVWAENLRDLLAALVGVRETMDTAPDITQLRWLFLTEDRTPVPLTGISVEEDDLSVYPEEEYGGDFSRCMQLAWLCLDPAAPHNDEQLKALAGIAVEDSAAGEPVRKVLARVVRRMLTKGRALAGVGP